MKIHLKLPWHIKPGMMAEVPQFARVESITKGRAFFHRASKWTLRFPEGTWPSATVSLYGKGNTLPAERWQVMVP